MVTLSYHRKVNINNYETIGFTIDGEGPNLNSARIDAAIKFIKVIQPELLRIFNLRVQNGINQPLDPLVWNQLATELQGLEAELQQLQGR